MARKGLPKRRNPLLTAVDETTDPSMQELVSRRRLGQTELSVEPGQVGTSNATKPNNLGKFDYAHLRVPLPKDLRGSGIFGVNKSQTVPEAYFLMRRSSDGYVSASGLFKVAFPWASQAEETTEKAHVKASAEADPEEIAGNVWIPPTSALELGAEYGIRDWVVALLDPTPMPKAHSDPNKQIRSPPTFKMASPPNGSKASSPKKSSRARSLRSASPTKSAPPAGRKIATPKRTKRGSTSKASLSPGAEEVNGDETVKVDIQTTTEPVAGGEATTTHVSVETPANHPDLKLPADAQAYLDQARDAIKEANKLTAGRSAGRKRKAVEIEAEDQDLADAVAASGDEQQLEIQPAKRVRLMEIELRKERMKRRATMGIVASLSIATLVPVLMGTFFQAL